VNCVSVQAKEGFETSFMVKSTEHDFNHNWKVVEVIDQKKLVINWTFSGYAGSSNSIFEIVPTGTGCKLTLTAIVSLSISIMPISFSFNLST